MMKNLRFLYKYLRNEKINNLSFNLKYWNEYGLFSK
jgi:hypothetical protein